MADYTVVRTAPFDKDIAALRKKFRRIEEDLKRFCTAELGKAPKQCGTKIPGVTAAWKARMGIPSARISKSGGLRLIYLISESAGAVALIMAYHKSEVADVPRKELRRAVEYAIPLLEQKMVERGLDPQTMRKRLLGDE